MPIEKLKPAGFMEYDEFVLSFPESSIYNGSRYLKFLEELTEGRAEYLIYREENIIKGALPLFIYKGKYGAVINSLPFYGSNGGVITHDDHVKQELLKSYEELVKENNCISSTIIVSPFERGHDLYEERGYDFKDSRIGQITFLPKENLMEVFHFKTRNSIRKGLKSGLSISWQNGLDYFDFLIETHKDNIQAVGGLWKAKSTFEILTKHFEYGSQWRIYVAKLGDQPVAALLTLYFNKTVEYFTPATVAEFRNLQPMSALIYEAMQDSITNDFLYWNWGGTWLSQGGVYDFKSRWGTKDLPYFYYIKVPDVSLIKSIGKEGLTMEYPFFYVIPYSEL